MLSIRLLKEKKLDQQSRSIKPIKIFTESSRLLRRFSSLSIGKSSIITNPLAPATIKPICLKEIECLPWKFAAYPRIAEITPPAVNRRLNIEDPLIRSEVSDPTNDVSGGNILDKIIFDKDLEMPASVINQIGEEGIQAAVLIGIRRRKMKKHKLKKLRKKMKFEWAKVRQRRELRKEKAFQAVLIAQIKEAEKFSAEAYVTEKLRQANETPIPRFWKGRRLPEFIIKEKMGIK